MLFSATSWSLIYETSFVSSLHYFFWRLLYFFLFLFIVSFSFLFLSFLFLSAIFSFFLLLHQINFLSLFPIFVVFVLLSTFAFLVFYCRSHTTYMADMTPIALLYTFTIVGVTVLNAASPLIFELACELAYPTGEGTTSGILSVAENLVIVIFLFVMMIPSVGKSEHMDG